jgi:DNA-binding PadR family transcriptional regulator
MLAKPSEEYYGLELMRLTRLMSGTLYPLLDRLVGAGWLSSYWEEDEISESGGPRRRFYKLTALGAHEAQQVLLEHGIRGIACA